MSAQIHGIDLFPGGQWFSEAGVQDVPGDAANKGGAIQAVLGEGIAREMGRDQGKETLAVGDLFSLAGRKWIVVGITRSEGSTFGSEVWAKWSLVTKMFGKEQYTSIIVRTADEKAAQSLSEFLTTNFKKSALQATPETEYFSRLNETSKQFMVAISFVTGIMSIGGIFGVMNTMFAAVSAGKRDIGVLRIVGFARWQVLAVFLAESLLIAMAGGALGVRLGFAGRWLDRQQHHQRRAGGRRKICGPAVGREHRHACHRHVGGDVYGRGRRFSAGVLRDASATSGSPSVG